MTQRGSWNAGCWGGRDSPGSCSGNGCQERGVLETPAVVEVAVERALEPFGCVEVGGEGSCQFSPQLKACQWQSCRAACQVL